MPRDEEASSWWLRGAWLFIALAGVVYAAVARLALHGFPYSGDEYSMLLQAELFARALLHAPVPANAALFRVDHVILDDFVRSKYPPGASALLAVGVRAGAAWLVTPIEGALTLCLVWSTARRELGVRAAFVSLVVLGAAPLFIFQAATFYSHTATTMWLALAFAAVSMWTRSSRDGWLLLAGAAVGAAFVTRPVDALFFGIALFALRSWRVVGLVVLGALPFAVLHVAYQAAQFGSPFADGYHAYEPTFGAIYGASTAVHPLSFRNLFSAEEQFHHLDLARALVAEWTVAGSVVVALFGQRALGPSHPARRMRNVAVLLVLVTLVGLLPMVADPDDGARPRYLSTVLLSIAFLSGAGWLVVRDLLAIHLGPRLTRVVVVAALVFVPVQIGAFFIQRLPLLWQREGLYRAVEKQGIKEGVVVIRARYPTRYARNGAFFDRPVLYLSAPPEMRVEEVRARFPGRPIYVATEGPEWAIALRAAP